MKILISSFFVVVSFGLSVCAMHADADNSKNCYPNGSFWGKQPEITTVEPKDFVIMPWGCSPGEEKALREVKECGFNLAGFLAPEYVKVAKKVGLKCIVEDHQVSDAVANSAISDAEIAKRVHNAVEPFRGNSTVFGYYIKDEPSATQFSDLARWKNAFQKEDPSLLAYINMHPSGIGANSFEDYIEKFASTINPTYLSYDTYTLSDDGLMNTWFFYGQIEAVRKASIQHNIPFWNIILANSHFHYAEATSGGLSVQVFSTLAYGGRGICYFTYFAPILGNYRNAAIDQFLNKTPTWDIIRRINLQLHQLAPTYLKLKSVNVFHHPNVPNGCSGIATSKLLSEVSGGDLLVGEFEGPDATPYVMIVNKDFQKSTNFSLRFKKEGEVMVVSPYTGSAVPFGGEWNWLAPGQGMLLTVAK